jgi:hypothetical protein
MIIFFKLEMRARLLTVLWTVWKCKTVFISANDSRENLKSHIYLFLFKNGLENNEYSIKYFLRMSEYEAFQYIYCINMNPSDQLDWS